MVFNSWLSGLATIVSRPALYAMRAKCLHLAFFALLLGGISCSRNELITIEGLQEVNLEDCVAITANEYVIDDEGEYGGLVDETTSSLPGCEDFELPAIDFAERTLLGKFTQVQGCTATYLREVFADPDAEVYEYRISIKISGECQNEISSMNWISVPKLPESYGIRYAVSVSGQ